MHLSELDSDTQTEMANGNEPQSREQPEWWQQNEQLREEMGLPAYRPPRFDDGVFTHNVVERLEAEYDCTITFRSKQPRHPCEWEIHIDGEEIGTTGRRRTDRGNTIYQLSSTAFVNLVESTFEPDATD